MAVESKPIPPTVAEDPGISSPYWMKSSNSRGLCWTTTSATRNSRVSNRCWSTRGAARQTYLGCVQMHVDLHQYFAEQPAAMATAAERSPLLGFLDGVPSPLDIRPPHPNDSTS